MKRQKKGSQNLSQKKIDKNNTKLNETLLLFKIKNTEKKGNTRPFTSS